MDDGLKYLINNFTVEEIENSAIKHFLISNDQDMVFVNELINSKINHINYECLKYLQENVEIKDLNALDKFFESMISQQKKNQNGIVFTPAFISDYIVKSTIKNFNKDTKIIDPSCGCGIFLISLLNYLTTNYKYNTIELIENNLYGIDLDSNNIERVKIILSLYASINGCDVKKISFNIRKADTLFCDWKKLFDVAKFDYIVGNPPYLNNHDLKKDYITKLKTTFTTTVEGTFNIFYAFIEKSVSYLSEDGLLGFIIPNNFIHIQSAKELRKFMKTNQLLNKIIDFKDNTIFYPVLTYNCIIFLSYNNTTFEFTQIEKKDNQKTLFENIKFQSSSLKDLNDTGWQLTSNDTIDNIQQIESFETKLNQYIRVGIATLKDKVYLIDTNLFDHKKGMYYLIIDNKKYYIENEIIIDYIKVSKFNNGDKPLKIIFPYHQTDHGVIPITETELKENYPQAYKYFLKQKKVLSTRNIKDSPAKRMPWYLYGRSQGLNNWEKKIVFAAFNQKPNFMACDYSNAVFSNGYSISGMDLEQDVLLKILNSKIMKFYIDNTSYSISGDFKCYQKKYVKNFSIPCLSKEDICFIKQNSGEKLDAYLINLYQLKGEI